MNTTRLLTFSLVDFPSGDRANLEIQIMEHALALWRKKNQPRSLAPHSPLPPKPKASKPQPKPRL